MIKKIFEYQIWHVMLLGVMIFVINLYITADPANLSGFYWGVSTKTWFWLAITIPIIHQVYVWLIWRIELYQKTFTRRYGFKRAFTVYAGGFSILFASRLLIIIILASSDKNTLHLDPLITYVIAALITPLVIYLFYSVKKYFTIARAYGVDHFDKDYSEPYVKKGIFKYTNNGMYVYGLMILYIPGLLLLSKAALVVALFNHAYIWVHYYFTERPDMLEIYGKTP